MESMIEKAQYEPAEGTGEVTVVKHIREIRVNYRGPKLEPKTIRAPEDAAAFIRKILPDNSREHFVVLYLNGAHQISSYAVISTGTASCCPVHPREVFQRAVMVGAVAIIAAHNHPSGAVEPSLEDSTVTEALKRAGELLGIKLLDHIILGDDSQYSLREMGGLK